MKPVTLALDHDAVGNPAVAIVLHSDRHADPEIHVFADRQAALTFADARLTEFDRFNDATRELTPSMRRSGWLFYGRYGEDGAIRVEMKAVRHA